MMPILVQAGEQLELKIRLFENQGTQNIIHAALYLNNDGNILNDLTATVITYEKYGEMQIQDPNGIISSADVTKSEEGNKAVFTFDITFAKETDLSDLLFRIWDLARNSVDVHLSVSDMDDKNVLNQEESSTDPTQTSNTDDEKVISLTPPKMSKSQLIELYKQQEIVHAILVRNNFAEFQTGFLNPYVDKVTDDIITFERVDNGPPKVVKRYHEIFQTMKDEQASIAEKKYEEIVGGRTITNLAFYENTRKEVTNVAFEIDEEIAKMKRNDENFQNYNLEQIILAEKTRDQILSVQLTGLPNPYERDENTIDNIPTEDVIELGATETPNEILTLTLQESENIMNHALSGNMMPNQDEFGQSRKMLERDHETFQSFMNIQIEIAQETLNKILGGKNIHTW